MQARLTHPAMLIPEVMPAIQALLAELQKGDAPEKTMHLVHTRASQINGCSVCLDGGIKLARRAGETDERIACVAGWHDAPYYTDAERAALALTECVTRLADRTDPVPDAVWNEARKHYDDRALAALLLSISLTNLFNRLNASTRQVAGAWKP